jgi:hypothetical protein
MVNDFILGRQLHDQNNLNYVNMRYFFILLTIAFSTTLKAQSAEDSIKAVVNNMFAAMKASDGKLLQSTFSDNAVLQTISRDKAGNTMVETDTVSAFAQVVNGLEKNAADEQITFETIKIDGPLAMVWAPYNFFYNGKFSHCGIDCFQLVRIKNVWKIQYLIDTRRKAGCTP